MIDEQIALGVFSTHLEAESAIRELQLAGFDMKKLSIVGQGYQTEENVTGFYNMKERMKVWGKTGALWGGVWGWIFGWALFVVPGMGPLLVGGPLISIMIGALEGAVTIGGLSTLGAAIASMGVPKNSVLDYETAVRAQKFLLIVHGTEDDLQKGRAILTKTGAQHVHSHHVDEALVGAVS